jgi:BirA family transcriptional regulator, biotin operon repressor / biotin---[acetyl-CoA-carboxylase] ligase
MSPVDEWHLDTHQLGRRVLVYDVTDSTSSRCVEHASDTANHGLVVLARAQTAGRGQHGRSWLCERDAGVLLSVLLFPPRELARPAILTAWAAVSVCELILEVAGMEARIKWPNDVLIAGRKVCGILIEQGRGVVAGLGLNLNQTPESFLSTGLPEAGSLHAFTGHTYDVEQLARRLIERLDQEYRRLLDGDVAGLEDRWRDRLGLVGELVEVEHHPDHHIGELLEVTFEGVVLQSAPGEFLRLAPELIKHIYPAFPS